MKKDKGIDEKKSNGSESNGIGLDGRIPKKRSKAASDGDNGKGDTQTSTSKDEDSDPPKKKMRADDDNDNDKKMEEGSDADDEIPLKIIRKRNKKAKSSEKSSQDHAKQGKADSATNNLIDIFMDPAAIRKECDKLDGSFSAARDYFIKRGPWSLPTEVDDAKYKEVAETIIDKICREDKYSLFADKVTEEEAPGYSDIVKKPMDFGSMREKLSNDEYGRGSKCISKLYEDFLLVIDNCALYNDDNVDVLNEAARIIGILPGIFADACVTIANKKGDT